MTQKDRPEQDSPGRSFSFKGWVYPSSAGFPAWSRSSQKAKKS